MNEGLKSKEKPLTNAPAPVSKARKLTTWLRVIALLGTFLIGFVPMRLKSSRLNDELFRAQSHARVEPMQLTFANAALDARHGDYEPARRGMTSCFNLVTAELDRGIGSGLPPSASEGLKPLLTQRDDLITLLARGDPASAERLATAYADLRKTSSR